MAWKIKTDEAVPHAVRRLARKALRRAVGSLAEAESRDAVHRARKEIKKVRALIRAVGAELRPRQCRSVRRGLRSAAHALAPARDTYVDWQTLRQMERERGRTKPRSTTHLLSWALERRWISTSEAFNPKPVCRRLNRVLRVIDDLRLRHQGSGALAAGIHDAYVRARAAAPRRRGPSREALHQWRKATKDLVILLKLLVPHSPEEIGALTSDLAMLADQLGQAHDLAQLQHWLTQPGMCSNPGPEVHRLTIRLARRERELARAALSLGRSLFLPTGVEFEAWLRAHWLRATAGKRGPS
jgi:CHAD domain-containing protein